MALDKEMPDKIMACETANEMLAVLGSRWLLNNGKTERVTCGGRVPEN